MTAASAEVPPRTAPPRSVDRLASDRSASLETSRPKRGHRQRDGAAHAHRPGQQHRRRQHSAGHVMLRGAERRAAGEKLDLAFREAELNGYDKAGKADEKLRCGVGAQ